MELRLDRKYKKSGYTIGKLFLDGEYFCDTLEDIDRGLISTMTDKEIRDIKIPGKTAIPRGRYRIVMNITSYKFSKYPQYKFCKGKLPRLVAVPGYEGVLIHTGNTPDDTDGCILVGFNREKGKVLDSTITFNKLYSRLEHANNLGEKIYITIG